MPPTEILPTRVFAVLDPLAPIPRSNLIGSCGASAFVASLLCSAEDDTADSDSRQAATGQKTERTNQREDVHIICNISARRCFGGADGAFAHHVHVVDLLLSWGLRL